MSGRLHITTPYTHPDWFCFPIACVRSSLQPRSTSTIKCQLGLGRKNADMCLPRWAENVHGRCFSIKVHWLERGEAAVQGWPKPPTSMFAEINRFLIQDGSIYNPAGLWTWLSVVGLREIMWNKTQTERRTRRFTMTQWNDVNVEKSSEVEYGNYTVEIKVCYFLTEGGTSWRKRYIPHEDYKNLIIHSSGHCSSNVMTVLQG